MNSSRLAPSFQCHCPACRWARSGFGRRLACWLQPPAKVLASLAALALVVVLLCCLGIYAYERALHAGR